MGSAVGIDAHPAMYGENAEFMDFFVPGIMAFVVYLLTTLLTLITFVGERIMGALERLLATPLRRQRSSPDMLSPRYRRNNGGRAAPEHRDPVFHISNVGNVLLLAFLTIALLPSSASRWHPFLQPRRTRAQAVHFIPFIVLPAFLLAGIFWPIEVIPAWLRPASYLVPPTYAVTPVAPSFSGLGADRIWPDLGALLVFAAVLLLLATLTLPGRRVPR